MYNNYSSFHKSNSHFLLGLISCSCSSLLYFQQRLSIVLVKSFILLRCVRPIVTYSGSLSYPCLISIRLYRYIFIVVISPTTVLCGTGVWLKNLAHVSRPVLIAELLHYKASYHKGEPYLLRILSSILPIVHPAPPVPNSIQQWHIHGLPKLAYSIFIVI